MPKPVCAKCQRFFRPLRNNVEVLENRPAENGAAPGLEAPESWEPYKLWFADAWQCPGCGVVIVTGFARQPYWEHYQGPMPAAVPYVVNDC